MNEKFRSVFTKSDLISAATVTTIANQFVTLGSYKVKAGELIALGFGGADGQENAQGRIYCDIKDGTPAVVPGTLRLSATTAQDRPSEIIFETRIEIINQNSTDRTKQLPFAQDDLWVSQDKNIKLEFMADAVATITKANCNLLIDMTKGVV